MNYVAHFQNRVTGIQKDFICSDEGKIKRDFIASFLSEKMQSRLRRKGPGSPPPSGRMATSQGDSSNPQSPDLVAQRRPSATQINPGEISRPINLQRIAQRKAQVRTYPKTKKLEKLGVYSSCKVSLKRAEFCSFVNVS